MSIEESKNIPTYQEQKTWENLRQAENYFLEGKFPDATDTLIKIDDLYTGLSNEESSIRSQTNKSQSYEILYWSKRGNIYYEYLKRYGEAAQCYEKWRKKAELNPLVYKALGDCSRKLHQFKEAHDFYDKALGLAERNKLSSEYVASIYHNKGLTFETQGELENAQNSYKTAIEKDPNNHFYLFYYGIMIFKNDPKKAGEYLRKANDLLRTGNSSKVLSKANILYIQSILSQIIEIKEQLGTIEWVIEKVPENKKKQVGVELVINKKNDVKALLRQTTQETLELIEEKKTSPNTNSRVLQLENQVQQMQKDMEQIKKGLKENGIELKELKSRLANYEQELFCKLTDSEKVVDQIIQSKNDEEKKKLKDYYHAFVSTIHSVYNTTIDNKNQKKRSSHGELLSTLVSLIPFYGDAASFIVSNLDELNEKIKNVKAAQKMIQLASTEVSLSQKVGKVVCEILKNPPSEKVILSVNDDYFEKNPNSLWKKGLAFIEKLGDQIEKYVYGSWYSTPAAKLGHEDANYLIKELLDPKKQAEFTITTSLIIKVRHENTESTSLNQSSVPLNNQISKPDKKSWFSKLFSCNSSKPKQSKL